MWWVDPDAPNIQEEKRKKFNMMTFKLQLNSNGHVFLKIPAKSTHLMMFFAVPPV